ncbi:hypothetical protein [Haladaptatus sp. NG-SE-30]
MATITTSLRTLLLGRSKELTLIGLGLSLMLAIIMAENIPPDYILLGISQQNMLIILVIIAIILGVLFSYLNSGIIVAWSLVFGATYPFYLSACSARFLVGGVEGSLTQNTICPVELPGIFVFLEPLPIIFLIFIVTGTISYILGRIPDSKLFLDKSNH